MASIPTYQREAKIEVNSTPEFSNTLRELGAAQNNLSSIGAQVAQSASNTMATRLGYESGKHPTGDTFPPITEFDKNFVDSYHTQAHATLSIQGQKLLTDAEVELSKPQRLTPQLIEKSNSQVKAGLDKIAETAPTAIKGSLQQSFSSLLIRQNEQFQNKMLSEQHEDQKNNIIESLELNTKNALELATSGNSKEAEKLIESSKSMAANAVSNRFLTPTQARIAHESVQQAALDGKYINLAMSAFNNNKYAEFEKAYSEKKPSGMTNEQWISTGQAFQRQVQFVENLRSQEENLKSQQMENTIAMDASTITGTQWKEFENSVSPLRYEKVKFKYIQALKSGQSSNMAVDGLIKDFSNPEAWANSNEKTQDAAFNKSVDYLIDKNKNSPNSMSHEDAQVQVAASAGGKISVFTNDLKNKLHSGNPTLLDSAVNQIHQLRAIEAGHALSGLNDQDKAIAEMYESLKNSTDPLTAARDTIHNVLNQDPAIQQMTKQKWSNFLSSAVSSGQSLDNFALNSVGLKKTDFNNDNIGQVYGTDILNTYSSFYQTVGGDQRLALKLTQQYVDENYGETGVNGPSHTTFRPLEKSIGFASKDGVPFIQNDVVTQLNQKFMPIKDAYASNKMNEYWEVQPISGKAHGFIHSDYDPIKIKRHMKTTSGEKVYSFNVILEGNSFDSWDIAIQTDSGIRNLFQVAPYLGVVNYIPNKKSIVANYNKAHQLK